MCPMKEAERSVASALLPSLLLAAFAVACAPAGTPGSAPTGQERPQESVTKARIVASIMSEPASLANAKTNPRGTIGNLAGIDELVALVHVGLASADDKGVLRPLLAEQVPSIDNGGWRLLPVGRMETTWTLKPGAAWHDGTP